MKIFLPCSTILMHRATDNIKINNNNKYYENKKIYVIGQGQFIKGFMEHINKDNYDIINIYKKESQLINKSNFYKKDLNLKTHINDKLVNIDVENKNIILDNTIINYKDNIIVYENENTKLKTFLNDNKEKSFNIVNTKNGIQLALRIFDTNSHMIHVDNTYTIDFSCRSLEKYIQMMLVLNNLYFEKYDYDIDFYKIKNESIIKSWKQTETLNLLYNHKYYTNVYFSGENVNEYDDDLNLYLQGKHVAKCINDDIKLIYCKPLLKTLYIGNNKYAIYIKNFPYYITIPKYVIKFLKLIIN